MINSVSTEEYNVALARTYELMQTDLKEGSLASGELEVLSLLINKYELVHYPLGFPNTIEGD